MYVRGYSFTAAEVPQISVDVCARRLSEEQRRLTTVPSVVTYDAVVPVAKIAEAILLFVIQICCCLFHYTKT